MSKLHWGYTSVHAPAVCPRPWSLSSPLISHTITVFLVLLGPLKLAFFAGEYFLPLYNATIASYNDALSLRSQLRTATEGEQTLASQLEGKLGRLGDTVCV